MTDNIENLLLEHLKALRNEVAILRIEMHDEFRDLKQRVTSLEAALVRLRGDLVGMQEDAYRQQSRIDQIVDRIERIERRLELIP
ncbi:hypothetical protein [Acidithiobacillus sulfuriphilus]|uniref:Uncharacterized protein n=2 Tax=Acidithiobacillus sulfuriphilus TaxID=1867749 RepID=A0A3M8QTC7_9PROT|nr:hypothetical protein [Acidithiobacillus sulfuriphilus]RNF59519.1 hypothetical protein EC580_11045 [Acidithiobacillus sulfuriphilus]